MNNWLSDLSANRYVKTYFNGFVDISGGDIILRNGGNLIQNNITIPLKYLDGINYSINDKFTDIDASINNISSESYGDTGSILYNNNQTITGIENIKWDNVNSNLSINSNLSVGNGIFSIIYSNLLLNGNEWEDIVHDCL